MCRVNVLPGFPSVGISVHYSVGHTVSHRSIYLHPFPTALQCNAMNATETDKAVSDAAALSSEAARIRQQELSSLRSQLQASLERTRILEKQVEDGEEERRRMHNTILDLSGSVRVYVRARPFLKSDGEGAAEQASGGGTAVHALDVVFFAFIFWSSLFLFF